MRIDNIESVLKAAKLKQKGWKRDYDSEPWVEDKQEWLKLKKEERKADNADARRAFFEEKNKTDTARFKKNSFKRWRKMK